ncbi:MAG: protein translocase subunit SecF [Mobilicoccus sp.]|nr:protein translocase subunit SecF [Mobilicoccus sp.]
MSAFSNWGNNLYTGRTSIDFVGRARTWYLLSLVLLLITLGGVAIRGINLGIEFTGGSDFRVPGVSNMDNYESRAQSVVTEAGDVAQASVTQIGTDTIRVQTERFDDTRAIDARAALAEEFGVPAADVTSSIIGPSWGESVTNDAIRALLVFLALLSVVLALYFRTWKMALAALVALLHDIVFTVGVYVIAGFEVTPASTIGFLTILGYSIYDTVVVFDKVRENTAEAQRRGHMTYEEASNLAVNQTLVRSINTSIVALLPVSAILVLAFIVTGPGTLRDLSLALFIGIAVGTYSSVFIATPLLVDMRRREPTIVALRERVERRRAAGPTPTASDAPDEGRPAARESAVVGVGSATTDQAPMRPRYSGREDDMTATGRPIHPYARSRGASPARVKDAEESEAKPRRLLRRGKKD